MLVYFNEEKNYGISTDDGNVWVTIMYEGKPIVMTFDAQEMSEFMFKLNEAWKRAESNPKYNWKGFKHER